MRGLGVVLMGALFVLVAFAAGMATRDVPPPSQAQTSSGALNTHDAETVAEKGADTETILAPKVQPMPTPPPQTIPVPTQVPAPEPALSEAGWKRGIATVFWVGEDETSDNGYIHNYASAFDAEWERHFGGVDDPDNRCGFNPCAFTPKENPFYIALPYTDLRWGGRKENAIEIPWYDPSVRGSQLKNRWIEVRANGTSCFGQWQDVGPFETDDIAYVFGEAAVPLNTRGMKAGIDLSPAMRDCLGIGGVAEVSWRHREASAVPDGPWSERVTE